MPKVREREKFLTRQRRYQLKCKEEGKCETCGAIAFQAGECRKHYVLRAMRRFNKPAAEALTRRILNVWNSIETQGLDNDYRIEPSESVTRWLAKWYPRIGGIQ